MNTYTVITIKSSKGKDEIKELIQILKTKSSEVKISQNKNVGKSRILRVIETYKERQNMSID